MKKFFWHNQIICLVSDKTRFWQFQVVCIKVNNVGYVCLIDAWLTSDNHFIIIMKDIYFTKSPIILDNMPGSGTKNFSVGVIMMTYDSDSDDSNFR